MSSEMRRRVQGGLSQLGFYGGAVDGDLGPATRRAIASYQESIGATATGYLTKGQVDLLSKLRTPAADVDSAPVAADNGGDDHPVPEPRTQGGLDVAVSEATEDGAPSRAASGPYNPFGITTFNGDILIGSGTIGRGRDAEATKKLAKLLLLEARPEYLDDIEKAINFVDLLPNEADRERFARTDWPTRWKGDNQFQREDSFRGFRDAYRRQILEMVPDLPLTIAEARSFGVGEYDPVTQRLGVGISTYEGWESLGFAVFDAPLPMTLPSTWSLPADRARSIVEATDADFPEAQERWHAQFGTGFGPSPTALVRYQIRDVRPIDKGVILDLAALDIAIYDRRGLTHRIDELPLPEDAITGKQEEQKLAGFVPYVDPMLPRLIAVQLKPDLLDNDTFVIETFRIKREMERRIRDKRAYNFFPDQTNWPRLLSSAALNSGSAPNAAEIAATRAWIASNAAKVGTRLTQPNACRYFNLSRDSRGECELAGRPDQTRPRNVVVGELLDFTKFDWSYVRMSTDWIKPAIQASKQLLPDSFDVRVLPAGGDIPTLVALSASPHWYGIDIPFDPSGLSSAALDLDVVSSRLHSDAVGNGFLLLEVRPSRIRYTRPRQQEESFDLPAPKARELERVGTLDILGVKLGMPLEDVAKALDGAMPGTTWTKSEYQLPDNVLSHVARFGMIPPGTANGAAPNDDSIYVVYDNDAPGKPAIAVGRSIKLSSGKFPTDESVIKEFKGKLEARYGQSSQQYADGRSLYWAVDDVTVAKLKSSIRYDDECSLSYYEQFDSNPQAIGRWAGVPLPSSCGEVLNAKLSRERLALFLFDGRRALTRAKALAAKTQPPPVPEVKF